MELERYQQVIKEKDAELIKLKEIEVNVVDTSEIDRLRYMLQEKNEELEKVTQKLFFYEKRYQECVAENGEKVAYLQSAIAQLENTNS